MYRSTSFPVQGSMSDLLYDRLCDLMKEPEHGFERDWEEIDLVCEQIFALDPRRGQRMIMWVARTRWIDDQLAFYLAIEPVVTRLQAMGLVSPYEPGPALFQPVEPEYGEDEVNEEDLP